MRLAIVMIVIALCVGLAGCSSFNDLLDLFGDDPVCAGGPNQGLKCSAPGDCPESTCGEAE